MEVHFSDRERRGLSAIYLASKDGRFELFNEIPPIEGHPAIAVNTVDQRDEGFCTVIVGVTDETTFDVPIEQSPKNVGKKDPCEVSALVAGMALQTMKSG